MTIVLVSTMVIPFDEQTPQTKLQILTADLNLPIIALPWPIGRVSMVLRENSMHLPENNASVSKQCDSARKQFVLPH